MEKLTKIEKWDAVLKCLSEEKDLLGVRDIDVISIINRIDTINYENRIDYPELTRYLLKFEKDGLLIKSKDFSIEMGGMIYDDAFNITITEAGLDFIESGGYRFKFWEAYHTEVLVRSQKETARILSILTGIMAAGTAVAAVYYTLEIYENYNDFFESTYPPVLLILVGLGVLQYIRRHRDNRQLDHLKRRIKKQA